MSAGVYKLTHKPTGLFYIGQSGDIEVRKQSHIRAFNSGRSNVKRIQAVYKDKNEILWDIYPTKDKYEAVELEKKLIHECMPDDNISNNNLMLPKAVPKDRTEFRHTSETIERIRISKTGTKHSDETKRKMSETRRLVPPSDKHRMAIAESRVKEITLNGITYSSTVEAARMLGISRQAVLKRRNKENSTV